MRLVKLSEAAKRLGISIEMVRKKVKAADRLAYRLGPKSTLVDIDEILKLSQIDSKSWNRGAQDRDEQNKRQLKKTSRQEKVHKSR